MSVNRQFAQRLDAWQEELRNQIVAPVMPVSFASCAAEGHLSAQEAEKKSFSPVSPGDRWGMYREYRWFRAEVTLPEELAGKRIVLLSGVGGEQLVFLDGRPAGSVDREHPYVALRPAARSFTLLIESYAGHGPRLESLGPCPPERDPLPPVTAPQCEVRESFLALWNEDAFQLCSTISTPQILSFHQNSAANPSAAPGKSSARRWNAGTVPPRQ